MRGPRLTLRHLMAAIAVLAVVFAVLRLALGFLLVPTASGAVGAAVGCRRDRRGRWRFATAWKAATAMLIIAMCYFITAIFAFGIPPFCELVLAPPLLLVAGCLGIVIGTMASIPAWLITDIRRALRRRDRARTGMSVVDRDTGYGDRSVPS